MDDKKKTFVPFAIPKNGNDEATAVYGYLDTWKSGEYFGWEYETVCPTTADIWQNIGKFEAQHSSNENYVMGFVVFCGWDEDPYTDVIMVGFYDDNGNLVINHDKADQMSKTYVAIKWDLSTRTPVWHLDSTDESICERAATQIWDEMSEEDKERYSVEVILCEDANPEAPNHFCGYLYYQDGYDFGE